MKLCECLHRIEISKYNCIKSESSKREEIIYPNIYCCVLCKQFLVRSSAAAHIQYEKFKNFPSVEKIECHPSSVTQLCHYVV